MPIGSDFYYNECVRKGGDLFEPEERSELLMSKLYLNQIGYRPEDRKVLVSSAGSVEFEIIDQSTGSILFRGMTEHEVADIASELKVTRGDFTSFDQPGRYTIRVQELQTELPLTISEVVYEELHQGLLKAFYYFRCGTELEERYAAPWTHSACHLGKARVYGSEEEVECAGGWHDAGDYGRYTVAGAKAVADLLLAYDCQPGAFRRTLHIPESENGAMPDVLHECRYELEFLLKLQDARSGGAYHKVTTAQFCGLHVMPEDDTDPLILSPISGTATGCLAAIMAMAARVYRNVDHDFASRCLRAAEAAWGWLELHPECQPFHNPPEIGTGEYGDDCDTDERFWAAAELFRTTEEEIYHRAIQEIMNQGGFDLTSLGWADVGGYGTIAYLHSEPSITDASLRNTLRSALLERADALMQVAEADGFGVVLQPEEYVWGSNMYLLNHAMVLLLSYLETSKEEYKETALAQLHYILGCNVMDQCYVSGFGLRPLMAPHYRPSAGDGILQPVPGMLSGGPNSGLNDEYVQEHLQGAAPAASFVDHELSYSTNEVTIYWNSPAVFVTSFFVSGQ